MIKSSHFIFFNLLMHIFTPSYEVITTSKFLLAINFKVSSLSSFTGFNTKQSKVGIHNLHSLDQFGIVLLGTMTKKNPFFFLNCFKYAIKAIDCIVFPRPISSAKIPLKPRSYKLINQLSPSN